MLGYFQDPDYGDITDPTSGRDLTINTNRQNSTTYPTTTIRVKPSETPLSEDTDEVTSFIESQTEITDLYSELSYDELKSVLEGWLIQLQKVKMFQFLKKPFYTNRNYNNIS